MGTKISSPLLFYDFLHKLCDSMLKGIIAICNSGLTNILRLMQISDICEFDCILFLPLGETFCFLALQKTERAS